MLVAIHQPNFLPWLGFFDKLARSDVFVLLDNVALQLTGGNYTNRVQMLVNGAPAWITVPLKRGREARERIDAAEIAALPEWRKKTLRTVEQSYAKAPYFASAMPIVERTLAHEGDSLVEMNLIGILGIAEAVNAGTDRLVRASTLETEGSSTTLLASIVTALGGTAYLTGHGAGGYQDDEIFAEHGIEVVRQGYAHPTYPQLRTATFQPGLSAIDALMNCGPAAAAFLGSRAQ